ncbi:MAG: hypothetical protein CL947_04635 [Epsilonproteobacteria bacterium]|nr:hypothetical protein [Campylobacterota bacterium]|tara:strand:+ start:158 stop:997 length:840 start_codon:yes stop_codon:yes gene_type:complete
MKLVRLLLCMLITYNITYTRSSRIYTSIGYVVGACIPLGIQQFLLPNKDTTNSSYPDQESAHQAYIDDTNDLLLAIRKKKYNAALELINNGHPVSTQEFKEAYKAKIYEQNTQGFVKNTWQQLEELVHTPKNKLLLELLRQKLEEQDIDPEAIIHTKGLLDEDNVQLVEASRIGDIDKVKQLLNKGVSPNVSDTGIHALEAAGLFGHVEVVKLLLERRATVKPWWYTEKLPARVNGLATRIHPDRYPKKEFDIDHKNIEASCQLMYEAYKKELSKTKSQ